jgi:hypothetical protein
MILEICKKYGIINFEINKDGSVDVKDDVHIEGLYLTEMPLRFNKVYGNFYCDSNNITSLKGSPNWVSGNFECSNNNIKSLEHSPKFVGGYFSCSSNELSTLEHSPKEVGFFDCTDNSLITNYSSSKILFECGFSTTLKEDGLIENEHGDIINYNEWCLNEKRKNILNKIIDLKKTNLYYT